MSDTVLKIFPVDPSYIPQVLDRDGFVWAVRAMLHPEASIIIIEETETFFVDQGANFERIVCPSCSEEIDVAWWSEAMTTAFSAQFRDLVVATPCCAVSVSLNDLHYEWPSGFARFVIEVDNPAGDIQSDKLLALNEIVGCTLRTIWAHY